MEVQKKIKLAYLAMCLDPIIKKEAKPLKFADLSMCLESIIKTSKPEYDSNFQTILALEDQKIEDESTFIIASIVFLFLILRE